VLLLPLLEGLPKRVLEVYRANEGYTTYLSRPGHAIKTVSWSSPWYRRFVHDLSRHMLLVSCDSLVSRLPPPLLPRVVSEVEPPVMMFGIARH